MEAFGKAKQALRKHLMNNKEKVISDLVAMRNKSAGNDIFKYVETLSGACSLNNLVTTKEITYDYSFHDIDYYNLSDELPNQSFYVPPPDLPSDYNSKKDAEISSGSFFC